MIELAPFVGSPANNHHQQGHEELVTLNTGTVLLNEAKLTATDEAIVCVLGRPRGGTTMTARLLEAAGVFMGEKMPITAEDPDFARLLRDPNPDKAAFEGLVDLRSRTHRLWGFKAPFRNHWDLLRGLERARFAVVFRDTLAVANRNRISASADIHTSMMANLELERNILQFISASKHPALLFSYEKALVSPREISEAILDFVGQPRAEAAIARLCQIIQPNESAYVTTQDPATFTTVLRINVLAPNRIAGWARRSDGSSVTIRIEIDGKAVASIRADKPRQDLAKHFGGEGRFAFNVDLPADTPLSKGRELLIRNAADNSPLFRKTFDG